jgi:hypothetical protein
LPNNIILLITINKFDPNLVLVNINKLKSYRFIADRTLQPVLVEPSDLVTDDLVQTKKHDALYVEPKGFQPIEFEPVCKIFNTWPY